MRTIVVGFDGSRESCDALHLARSLAEPGHTRIVVASVADFIPPHAVAPDENGLRVHFRDLFGDPILDDLDFERREVRDGFPARALSELAEAENAELVVVGSSHQGRIGRVFPGSVGERLLNSSPCAVAVAPRGFAGHEHYGLGRIGVGYDAGAESKLALALGEQLASEHGCSLTLIGVVPSFPAMPSPGISTPRLPAYSEAVREHFRHTLEAGAAGVTAVNEVEIALDDGDPAADLARRGVELDLLVVGSRGRGPLRRVLLGSVAATVIRTAPCPVIVTPRPADAENRSELAAAESGSD